MRTRRIAALLGLTLVVGGLGMPTAAADDPPEETRPDFQMPFSCGETWALFTYADHSGPGNDYPEQVQQRIDMQNHAGTEGSDVLASAAGTVHHTNNTEIGGINMQHADGWWSQYLHMRDRVPDGTQVEAGDRIGTASNVGTTDAHLHYQQMYDFDDNGYPTEGGEGGPPELVDPVIEGELYQITPETPVARERTQGCDGGDPGDPPDENGPPVVDAGPDASGTEGDPIELAGSVTDPDGDAVDTMWTITPGDGTDAGAECTLSAMDAVATTVTCTDDGTFEATLTGADAEHTGVSDSATVTVENAAPSAQITSPQPGTLVDAAQPVPVEVTFTDPGTNDTHDCLVDFGDGSEPVTGEVTQSAGECVAQHSYDVDGVGPRTITATVQDDDGAQAPATTDIVVYVPGSGHVLEATGAVEVTPTPDVSCPPDTHQSAPILSTPVAELDTLSVDCTVDTTTGQTDVVSSVAEARLLTGLVTIEGIESTCTASADGIERTSHVGTINGISIGSEPGTLSLLGGLVAVHYNESTTDDEGHLTQNALRVVAAGQEVTIASCQLG